MKRFLVFSSLWISFLGQAADLPAKLDLRNVGGKSYVSSVKKQSGGTCWTHSTMAALESNVTVNGAWSANGENGEANLAEYHLDWWNGFNQHWNKDTDKKAGLPIHQGGDYRVATAYLARGGGSVRDIDGQSYNKPPLRMSDKYHVYYTRDVEWFSAGKDLRNLAKIKQALVDGGVMGTALAWTDRLYSNNTFYQPANDKEGANHAVAIVGWDDAKKTKASKPGAWLIKNSWGPGWGSQGYFWISYYDKFAGQDAQMGAVSFKNTERLKYDHIYTHDFHGWRDTKTDVSEAFNAFTAEGREAMKAVSFYTAADGVSYTVKVFGAFENGELSQPLAEKWGLIENTGFHTIDLDKAVTLRGGDKFYVYVKLSGGGHPFDKTSVVPVLLCGNTRPVVESKASPGESFYRTTKGWVDLTTDDKTANFTIKALTVNE